jgi:predicted short-subunit dehydrogenase-like oxidoreductase (DUF2520 family)
VGKQSALFRDGSLTMTAAEMREKARKLHEAARSASGNHKLTLLKSAKSWLQLADEIDEYERIWGPPSSNSAETR